MPRWALLFGCLLGLMGLSPQVTAQHSQSKTERTVVWNGFSNHWRFTSHRLSRLRHGFGPVHPSGPSHVAEWETGIEIGNFPPDWNRTKARGMAVASDRLRFRPLGPHDLVIRGQVGHSARTTKRVRIPLANLQLAGVDRLAVCLRGFGLEAKNGPGYHTRGFGIWLTNLHIDPLTASLAFDVTARLHAANSPDPLTRKKGSFAYKVQVETTLIAGKRSQMAITAAQAAYGIRSPGLFRAPRPKRARRTKTIRGTGGSHNSYDGAFLGVTGFNFRLDARTAHEGRYLRDLRFAIKRPGYDPQTRDYRFEADMYFSNHALWTYGFRGAFAMNTLLFEVADPNLKVQAVSPKTTLRPRQSRTKVSIQTP